MNKPNQIKKLRLLCVNMVQVNEPRIPCPNQGLSRWLFVLEDRRVSGAPPQYWQPVPVRRRYAAGCSRQTNSRVIP
jgi:hypothetical protein